MVTLFEYWNGGRVQWDGRSPPQFAFEIPPGDEEMITFFQLSGRICEVLTRSEWVLNLGGHLFDIPNLISSELDLLVKRIESEVGYVPVSVPYQIRLPFAGATAIPLALWASTRTGRADMYSPSTGLVRGMQLLPPSAGIARPSSQGLPGFEAAAAPMDSAQYGNGSLMQSLAGLAGDSQGISDFLTTGGTDFDYGGASWDPYQPGEYDASRQFEDDSAGWPGGAYENPDSNWYSPDY